jgi:proteasome beta subunit
MQGLVVVPLFAGYDTRRRTGRIFRYDVTGGRWEDEDYYATGSGGRDARGSLKKRYRHGMDGASAVDALVEALYDAADEDAATGGPDLVRGIFPVVATVTAEGYRRLPDAEVRKAAERVVDARARGEG